MAYTNKNRWRWPGHEVTSPEESLAQAIIMKAIEDYRRLKDPVRLRSIERFFRSQWFGVLCDLDPETLILKLQKEKTDEKRFA